jgi:hypothetical protein
MNLVQEISKNKFLLVLLKENQYTTELNKIIKLIKKTHTRIGYVCLNKPYRDAVNDLKDKNININSFFFIDTLSSHYAEPEPAKNCIFLKEPVKLIDIKKAIKEAVSKHKCSVIIFDTVSTLLIYESTFSIMKFTNELVVGEEIENASKVYIVLKESEAAKEDVDRLTNDLSMIADKTIDLNNISNIKHQK